MVKIALIDRSVIEFDDSVTPFNVANKISASLAKNALYGLVDNVPYDLNRPIINDSAVHIVTNKDTERALEFVRHDLAHILAEAVTELFPNVKLGIGPATDNGFFYDFLLEHTIGERDLAAIEQKMLEIIARDEQITRESWSTERAKQYFTDHQEILKLDILSSIPDDEIITVYRQGNFLDLCRGPHASSTGKASKHFKLTKVSAVYWKGDRYSHSLQRVSGVAFLTDKDLNQHQALQEEAKKRDHRKLGQEMDWFHFQEEAVGSVFWHPKGWVVYLLIEKYIRDKLAKNGYQEVRTPQILSRSLWEKSGHWEKFHDDIFIIETEKEVLATKPMNCPAHIEIFKQGIKSYKDLPLRISEFGSCFRNEPSGALHGLMRVRAFTQDDAHIFCTQDQIESEVIGFTNILKETYKDFFGNIDIVVKFSDRPHVRAGSDELWDSAEYNLMQAAQKSGLEVVLNKGEGAFYGPKLEFTLKDSLGRSWQVGTLQLDYVVPERLGAKYIDSNGTAQTPVLIHRAILGSFERFIGILIEHYAGRLPFVLAPQQVVIATITDEANQYAKEVLDVLSSKNIRASVDLRNEKINYKIREHSLQKVPVIIVVGKQEQQQNTVMLRFLGCEQQQLQNLSEAAEYLCSLNQFSNKEGGNHS